MNEHIRVLKDGMNIWADGSQEWWLNGNIHREDGPAVIYANGTQAWYRNGKLHREEGPALIWNSGTCGESWYLDANFFGNTKPENWEELVKLSKVEFVMEV